MKRFSKILIFLLALVAIVTAFTVVALATEEEPVTLEAKLGASKDYNGYEDGATIQNSSSKRGKATAVRQDDGNVYMLISYESATGSNPENIDTTSTKCYLPTYPYALFSFDVMSPNGSHSANTYFASRLYKGSTSVGYFTDAYVYMSAIGLSTTPYEWQHVSVVVEQDPTTLDFYLHVFDRSIFRTIRSVGSRAVPPRCHQPGH